jgi:hypothetical protein
MSVMPPLVRVTPGFVAACCILLFSTIAPALGHDDAVFLNFVNNVERRPLLFYYNGYVALIPELTAALLSPLPLLYQALLYRLPPLVATLLLYREMRRLLAFSGVVHGSWLALAILMVLGAVMPSLWANVALTQWLALLIATCYVTRINAGGGSYSVAGAAGVVFAALAAPPGIILAGLMLAHAITKVAPFRSQALLAAAIAIPLMVVTLGDRELQVNTDPLAAPFHFIASFRASRYDVG